MSNSITSRPTRKRPGQLVDGYRITGIGKGYKPFALPTIFSPDTPRAWYDQCSDEMILAATLRRRGRLVGQFRREVQA